jgi:hypothetical protein
VQIDALQVYAIAERVLGEVLLEQGDAVLAGEDPDVMLLRGRQHDLQTDFLLGALPRLACVRRQQDPHRVTLRIDRWICGAINDIARAPPGSLRKNSALEPAARTRSARRGRV